MIPVSIYPLHAAFNRECGFFYCKPIWRKGTKMRERKNEKELVIKVIITGADAEELDEPEYWTEEEEGILNELVAYAESVAEAIIGKPKKEFDECIFLHTLRIAKCMHGHELFSEAMEFLADILRVRGDEDTGRFVEGLTEYLEYDEDFCEYFLDVLFEKLADENDDYAFLCEEDCHGEM